MVMKRPRADSVFFYVVNIAPLFARADGIAAIAVIVVNAKGPRAIRIHAVMKTVQMKTARLLVGIEDVDIKPLPWLRVNHGPRNPAAHSWLVDVLCDERVGFEHGEISVQVFAVHQCAEPAAFDFGGRNFTVLVIHHSHAIDAMFVMLGIVGSNR